MNQFPKFYNKIFDYSLKKGTHIKFKDLMKTYPINSIDRKIITTKHIYNELPIRLANRVTDLNNLPFGLSKNHSINKVREWYLTSCMELFDYKEPTTMTEIIEYKGVIENIYKRHSNTLLTITKGLYELKNDNKLNNIEEPTMQKFLNRFYTNRTEIRILLEQYMSLFSKDFEKNNHFGMINLKSSPYLIINNVIDDIQYICNKNNLDIELNDCIRLNIEKNIVFPSMDAYLHHMFMELIKNSVKAVIEKRDRELKNNINTKYKPYIDIFVSNSDNNCLLLKIEDNGIGIKDENKEKIWYYSFSTSNIDVKDILDDKDFSISTPLSGFGYGLPITDIYLNFFNSSNNNIKIESTYKEGTSIYLYLTKYKV